jgi:Flp pilus assembly protein TadG
MSCGRVPSGERGATAVEFALLAPLLITLLVSITAFGHLLHTMQAVDEALRAGARIAVVCDQDANAIRAGIADRVPQLSLTNAQIAVQYQPAGCDSSSCRTVRVSLNGVTYTPWTWALPVAFPMPPFATTLPRESMESVNAAGEVNPVCT